MALKNVRRYPNRAQRRTVNPGVGSDTRLARRTPIALTEVVALSTTVTTILFDQPVVVSGIPGYLMNGTVAATAVTVISAEQIGLTHPVTTVTAVTVPFEDVHVRNGAGGYVTPGSYDVS